MFQWSSAYSVGVEELDDQHKKIFSIINRIAGMRHGDSDGDLVKIIDELKDYSIYHFKTEIGYLEKYDYPALEGHESQHKGYREKVDDFMQKVSDKKEEELAEKIYKFLKDWWSNHILQVDMDYADFLNNKGVS
jgi:hemerythrin-like metal-binding protein